MWFMWKNCRVHEMHGIHVRISAQIDELLTQRSGWGALAGDKDFRAVEAAAASGCEEANLAIDVFVHRSCVFACKKLFLYIN